MSDAEPGVPGRGRPRPADAPASRSVTLRATAVLGAFDREHRCLNLSQLSRRSGLPLATVHRLAAALVEGRLVVRRGAGRSRIGGRMWGLGVIPPVTHLRGRGARAPGGGALGVGRACGGPGPPPPAPRSRGAPPAPPAGPRGGPRPHAPPCSPGRSECPGHRAPPRDEPPPPPPQPGWPPSP